MWGNDNFPKRNGHGIQEWPDGSKYEGEFKNNLKHGSGVFTWANGEDYRHGKGTYSWPNGSKFTGKFYLNRKEGYGIQVFSDGATFKGLYHADERFGPGVLKYPDGRKDVGLWHRERLLRLCTILEGGFTLRDFPEHMDGLPKKHLLNQPQLLSVESRMDEETDQDTSEDEERFILPPDIERYSTDSDHLPVPKFLRQELDMHFFGRSDISVEEQSPPTALPLQQRMNGNIQRHRFEIETLDWDVAAVLNINRDQFGPKGQLELNSEKLIKEASHGDSKSIYQVLRDGNVHPDVSDAQGHTALIAATVNCHNDVIHLLLNSGADVNKLNDEGMSALAVCSVLYYPFQSLCETLAEKITQNISSETWIKPHTPFEDVSQESSPDPMTEAPKDESGEETFETTRQNNHADKNLEPENFNYSEKLEALKNSYENKDTREDEIVTYTEHLESLNVSEDPEAPEQINKNKDVNKDEIVTQQPEGLKNSVEPLAQEPIKQNQVTNEDETVPQPDQPEGLKKSEVPLAQEPMKQNHVTNEDETVPQPDQPEGLKNSEEPLAQEPMKQNHVANKDETVPQPDQPDGLKNSEEPLAQEPMKQNHVANEDETVPQPDEPEGLKTSEEPLAQEPLKQNHVANEDETVPQPDEPEALKTSEEPLAQEPMKQYHVTNEDETVPQPDQPEGLKDLENLQAQNQSTENMGVNKEAVLQPELEQDRQTVEPHVIKFSKILKTRSIQVFDDKIPVGSVSWQEQMLEKYNNSEKEIDQEMDEGLERSIKSDDPTFDSACSMASFHIYVTEEDLQKSAEALCQISTVTPADTQETVWKIALLKTEHRNRWVTIKLLLERGADPNASTVPMPVIFLAIKASHVEGVRRLLECGACTDIPLPPEQKGLYPLHISAGLPGVEGTEITELLLHALADPDVKAEDADEVYELDKNMFEIQAFENKHFMASGPPAKFSCTPVELPQEGGRTPLHVACQRDSDYTNARDVVALLLSHRASTNHLWSGHSPLSLAIASGNDLAVDELLDGGVDPNLPLTRHVGSALCALANINYDGGPHPRNQVKLLEKLIKAGANILQPVMMGEGRRCAVGTVVDYAHYAFQQDQRVAHTPYHALNKRERQVYNSRRQLLGLMGDLLRQAAIRMERCRVEEERSQGILSVSPSERFVYTGTGATQSLLSSSDENDISRKVQRKPLFKYCYQCGRSVGVVLSACSRCLEVFYCSKTCKIKAWDERHRDECIRVPVVSGDNSRGKHTFSNRRQPLSAKDVKGKTFHLNVTPEIQEYDLKENYSFI
ncbi:ankyrin repeat and MYND domain-containing protein 1-like isoform X2 [Xyrauchen texanus]|uniref:ankyrin repeat and MYND domain-containing protein 1-like isoform X2 n=1 Tax=Xyrauchen texanus TaxID=154827 RepID=UPI0022420B7A|nr:ankyrin repeat and MYND domain-containing protein 1-like isoform X2 [Xyrauchen texanus]